MELARRLAGPEYYTCDHCAKRPHLYEQLGHDGPPTNLWRENLATGDELLRCPMRDRLAAPAEAQGEATRYVTLYFPEYEKGNLLTHGGVADQPARYWALIRWIGHLRARNDAKLRELQPPAED